MNNLLRRWSTWLNALKMKKKSERAAADIMLQIILWFCSTISADFATYFRWSRLFQRRIPSRNTNQDSCDIKYERTSRIPDRRMGLSPVGPKNEYMYYWTCNFLAKISRFQPQFSHDRKLFPSNQNLKNNPSNRRSILCSKLSCDFAKLYPHISPLISDDQDSSSAGFLPEIQIRIRVT